MTLPTNRFKILETSWPTVKGANIQKSRTQRPPNVTLLNSIRLNAILLNATQWKQVYRVVDVSKIASSGQYDSFVAPNRDCAEFVAELVLRRTDRIQDLAVEITASFQNYRDGLEFIRDDFAAKR